MAYHAQAQLLSHKTKSEKASPLFGWAVVAIIAILFLTGCTKEVSKPTVNLQLANRNTTVVSVRIFQFQQPYGTAWVVSARVPDRVTAEKKFTIEWEDDKGLHLQPMVIWVGYNGSDTYTNKLATGKSRNVKISSNDGNIYLLNLVP